MNKTMETLPKRKQFNGSVILSGAKNLSYVRRCFTTFSKTWFREKTKEEWRFINATARTCKIYKDLANCVLGAGNISYAQDLRWQNLGNLKEARFFYSLAALDNNRALAMGIHQCNTKLKWLLDIAVSPTLREPQGSAQKNG